MSNPNLLIWTSDWHLVSNDTDAGAIGNTYPKEAAAVVEHLLALDPAGVIDTGDAKDHYGAGQGDEQDNYVTYVRNKLPWLPVNAAGDVNATQPILPGNHDEIYDYTDTTGTDWSMWDARFWATPYHWTADWAAPKIRVIALHANIIHAPDALNGYFQITAGEVTWLQTQIDALPAGWTAIVCSHPAALATFGNQIAAAAGGTALIAALAANNTKIVAYLNGHRHSDLATTVQDGITHFNGPSMAYTTGAATSRGAFVIIEYLPASGQLKFHTRLGPPSFYDNYQTAYTPALIQLPAAPGAHRQSVAPSIAQSIAPSIGGGR